MPQVFDPLHRLLQERRFEEAEALCRTRLHSNPADATALRFLLPYLLQRDDAKQARALGEQAVRT
ncbi:MAG TPA: hypothetical protein VGQ93_09815, partial [Lysobacter sp.]|nr:hypothetical protein [Lysobacter sp.]